MSVSEGERLRDEALVKVEQGVGSEWWKKAMRVLKQVCLQRKEFTTDILHVALSLANVGAPREPRVIGALMRRAKQLRWCFPTERTRKSKRPEAHSRDLRVWRSKLI